MNSKLVDKLTTGGLSATEQVVKSNMSHVLT